VKYWNLDTSPYLASLATAGAVICACADWIIPVLTQEGLTHPLKLTKEQRLIYLYSL